MTGPEFDPTPAEWLPTHGHAFKATSDGHGGYDDECQACGFASGQHELSDRITAAGDEETANRAEAFVVAALALRPKFDAAKAAVLHGVTGTCALDIDGVSESTALDIAADFITAFAAIMPLPDTPRRRLATGPATTAMEALLNAAERTAHATHDDSLYRDCRLCDVKARWVGLDLSLLWPELRGGDT